jgi:hypothetical protein
MRAETIGRRQDGSRIDGVNSGDRIVARATLLAFLRFRKGFDSLAILNYQFGWLRGLQKLLKGRNFLVAGACNTLKRLEQDDKFSEVVEFSAREWKRNPQAAAIIEDVRHFH